MKRLPHQQLGSNVCRRRLELGLTQEQLAEQAEISRRYLQQIEAGEMNPTINIVTRIRVALRCSWDQICEKI